MNNFKIQLSYDQSKQLTEEQVAEFVLMKVTNLISEGALVGDPKDILIDYEVPELEGVVYVELENGCLLDAAKLNTEGASMVNPEIDTTPRTFSVASIRERLTQMDKAPRARLKTMIRDYVKYYQSQSKNLMDNQELLTQFLSLFVLDLMGLFNDILPEIKSGKQLGTLLGLKSVSNELNEIAGRLSVAYKKALRAEESSGQLTKGILSVLKETYSEFIHALVNELFFKDIVLDDEDEDVQLSSMKRVPFNL